MYSSSKFTIISLSTAFVGSLIIVAFYVCKFGVGLSNEFEVWAWLGDYLGGTIGVFLTFISFIALLYTIILQSKELAATREELTRTRKAQESAIDYSRLNALLALRINYLEIIKIEYNNDELWSTGKDNNCIEMEYVNDSYIQRVRETIADAQGQLHEVNKEINEYHRKVVKNEI